MFGAHPPARQLVSSLLAARQTTVEEQRGWIGPIRRDDPEPGPRGPQQRGVIQRHTVISPFTLLLAVAPRPRGSPAGPNQPSIADLSCSQIISDDYCTKRPSKSEK